MATLLGPVQLTDPDKKRTDSSAPQVTQGVSDDSRLVNYQSPCLNYCQIRKYNKNPTAKLAKWAIFSGMIHTPWDYYSVNGRATPEMVNLVRETMTPIRDQFLLQAVFGTLAFGWQPFEVIYRPEGGWIWIDTFKALLQDFTTILVYTDTGRFAGFDNETFGLSKHNNSSTRLLEKYAQNIVFEFEGTDWYGESVYESVRYIVDAWDGIQTTATRYDSKVAGATWCIWYPPGKTSYNGIKKENHEIALSILNKLEASGSVAIPDEIQDSFDELVEKDIKGRWRIELISATGSAQVGFVDRQKYLDALILRSFGCTERSLLEGKHGTKEEADVHADVTLSIVDSRHRLICNQLNCYAVANFMEMNFGKKMRYEVGIRPAPLIDSQLKIIKEMYRTVLQNPDIAIQEVNKLDMVAMRTQLNLPDTGDTSPYVIPKESKQKGEGTGGNTDA